MVLLSRHHGKRVDVGNTRARLRSLSAAALQSDSTVRIARSWRVWRFLNPITAIQLLKLSGFSHIITTASLSNEAYIKSLGATHVIDRKLPLSELSQKVKEITSTPITVAYDAISGAETQAAAYEHLAPGGGLVLVLANAIDKSKITPDKYVTHVFGSVQHPFWRDTGVSLYSKLTQLLESGEIKVSHVS